MNPGFGGLFVAPLVAAIVLLAGTADSAQVVSIGEQQIQCYACGLPRVHPNNDIPDSYGERSGKKLYNESCAHMLELARKNSDGEPDERFVRTCPVGVKSCFGATGFYDHLDEDSDNDITVEFLGCSEAKYEHDYGCDAEKQRVDIRDGKGEKVQVNIDVNLCFCSSHLCNSIDGDLMKMRKGGASGMHATSFVIVLGSAVAVMMRGL